MSRAQGCQREPRVLVGKLYRQGQLRSPEGGQLFLEVGVVGEQEALPAPVTRSGTLIEVELQDGIRLRMDSRIEEAALQRVLRAVKNDA